MLVDRGEASVENTAKQINEEGGECTTVTCDVATPEDVGKYVSHAVETLGGIDVLDCNVSIAADDTTTAMSTKRWYLVYRSTWTASCSPAKRCSPTYARPAAGPS